MVAHLLLLEQAGVLAKDRRHLSIQVRGHGARVDVAGRPAGSQAIRQALRSAPPGLGAQYRPYQRPRPGIAGKINISENRVSLMKLFSRAGMRGVLAFVLVVFAGPAVAEVSVRISQHAVHVNQAFDLILDSTGEEGGPPDLAALRSQFDVLSQSTSETTRVINGRRSSRSELRLTLMAREAGDQTIPPIRVGSEQTEAIPLKVLESASEDVAPGSDKIFVEVSAEPKAALVQSQVLYTVRLYWAAQLSNLRQVSAPETEGPYTVVERVGNAREYQQIRDGVAYRVSELRYALFPQTPGMLTIKPTRFTAYELDQGRGGFNPFGYAPAGPGKSVGVSSEALQVTIKPIPAKAPSKPWLPAASLQVQEAWPTEEPEFRVGRPIKRTLMVVAEGLPAAKLPPLEPSYPKSLKTYSENATLENRPSEKGLIGVRQERVTIVPTEDGRFRLPAIQIHWWNTAANRPETAELPARSIRVLPTLPGAPQPAQPPAARYQQQYPLVAPPTAPWSSTQEPPLEAAPPSAIVEGEGAKEAPWLVWLSLLLGIGWLGTATAWWMSRRDAARAAAAPRPRTRRVEKPPPLPPALEALRSACEDGDRHAAQDALLAWGRQSYPDQPVTSLGALASLTSAPLRAEIQALDRSLYGAQGSLWSGQRLWDALRIFRLPKSRDSVIPDQMLTPLNPGS